MLKTCVRPSVIRAYLVLFALSILPLAAASQDSTYANVQPARDELPALAEVLRARSPDIAQIWPGFWSQDEPFLLLSPRGGMLLVAAFAPPSEYSPLAPAPAPLRDRAYTRDGSLPGMAPSTFPGTVEIGQQIVYALPAMGSTLSRRVSFYVHEAFHYYQRKGSAPWTATPEDTIMGLSPREFLRDPSVVDHSAFRAGLRRENAVLARIVTLQDERALFDALRSYLELRTQRLRNLPDVRAIERRYERREGTAEYVGCRAAALAFHSQNALTACIVRNLTDGEPEDPVTQFLRWRPYSVGAVLSLALDRLSVPAWKETVAKGEHLDVIATRVVQARRSGTN